MLLIKNYQNSGLDLRKNILLVLSAVVLLSFSRVYLFGQHSDTALEEETQEKTEEGWSKVSSAYFTVYYRPDANLKRIFGRIDTRAFSVLHNPPVPASVLSGIEDRIAYRLDMLFTRVKEILDMFPPGIHVNIKIFKNRKEVNNEFCRLARSAQECRSFYIYSHNTIYTSEQDISDSVIAHEMTHALVDHYFSATPPGKVAEILATNVDLHLDD